MDVPAQFSGLPASPSDKVLSEIGGTNKLTDSHEKLEQKYNQIMEKNKGKLFEVHHKKAGAGALLA